MKKYFKKYNTNIIKTKLTIQSRNSGEFWKIINEYNGNGNCKFQFLQGADNTSAAIS